MAALTAIGEDPQVWQDLALVSENWTWDDLRAVPDWVARRAILWSDTLGAWRKAQVEKK